ncbi:LysR family transcriptional regulator [Nocardiopsis sp. HNM0947]|uniref:LysR family transcriptional regulator n=1 Tax=Nocardiopsis coralli TaxID=2772213 RepID=A0ABR9P1F5_9ACTN|nr:LysR family transcriptional regulator [Nocardiopsis coralli]MBE2997590.1 LysR family transcriptional regulator [Nocardiopsis coralli]
MSVELRHLRALVVLGECDTFTTAAAVLGTTQPTLSRTIAQLEEALGARLVERTTREFALTRAGLRFAEDARGVLGRLDTAVARAREEPARPLRLGLAWAGLGEHTVPLLRAWRDHSATPVEVARPEDPRADLVRGRLDAAVVRGLETGDRGPDGLVSHPLFTECLVAAVASSNPLSRRRSVDLAELSGHPVALCRTAPTVTLDLWESRGHAAHGVAVANTDEWLTRIALGEAVGVTASATVYGRSHPEVAYLPVEDSPRVDVALTWHAERRHPDIDAFASFCARYFAQHAPESVAP